jgi:hypothetical protein
MDGYSESARPLMFIATAWRARRGPEATHIPHISAKLQQNVKIK